MAPKITPLNAAGLKNARVKLKDRVLFSVAALAILSTLFWSYWNHFDNEFEFDDDHCIVRNSSLDTMDIKKFMTDVSTYSTYPRNQAWRPGITILNSIDTIRSDNRIPDPVKFHQHIFASYILLGVLVFFMLLHLLRKTLPDSKWVHWVALFCTGFFCLHTANAETINYVIARSDSQSTLFIVLAMVLFMYSEIARKYFLYIIPMALGFLVKESAIMFAPILLVFCWLFSDLRKNAVGISLSFVAGIILYFISRKMTPPTWESGGTDAFLYLCTQAYVIMKYVFTFVYPNHLSADTDMKLAESMLDARVIVGAIFILAMLVAAVFFARRKETRMASFGIFWFFLALAPTSSIVPFAEVMNDHRIFFPFIGLIMVVSNGAALLYRKFEKKTTAATMKWTMIGLASLILIGHAYGTRIRCEVWDNNETLWKDVTIKSPDNARGWMNYGLALMERNAVDSAIILYEKTLSVSPTYVYAHINMGVAHAYLGHDAVAENHYKTALQLDPGNPEVYYFYGDWLIRKQRVEEGVALLEKGHEFSPGHSGINDLLTMWRGKSIASPLQTAIETADKDPTPENLVALSLAWYNAGEYLLCVAAAEKAVELKPDYGYAWNNICAAYNKLGEFEKAVVAGKKAVELLPEDQLSKNNLSYAEKQKGIFDALIEDAKKSNSADNWLYLSLQWYNAGNFKQCITAAEEVIKIDPNNFGAWNNICAASNKLGDFERGIEAGEKALQLDPNSQLAKNNLVESKRLKELAGK